MIVCPECEVIHLTDKLEYCTECGYSFEIYNKFQDQKKAAEYDHLFKN